MFNKQSTIAVLAGAATLFVWGFVAHMFTPIGTMGIKQLPDADADASAAAALSEHMQEPGFYFLPGDHAADLTGKAKEQELAEWTKRYEKGPTAIVIFHPAGTAPMSGKQLGLQFVTNLLTALLAVGLLKPAVNQLPSYSQRVLFVVFLGVLCFVAAEIPNWNWFRYPADYITGKFLDLTIGHALLGLVIAALLKPAATSDAPAD